MSNEREKEVVSVLLNHMETKYDMNLWNLYMSYTYEEGYYIVMKRTADKFINIIGLEPTLSNSLLTPNEVFNIVDITNSPDHFIHKEYTKKYGAKDKLYIVCDEQGGALIIDKNNKYIENYKGTANLDDYIILYETFYEPYASQNIKTKEHVHNLLTHLK